MTLTVGQDTSTVRMRAIFSEDTTGALDLVQAQDHFFDLSGFLYVNYLATQALDIRGGYGASLEALVDTKVLRISYASPLEVTLAVSSLAGSAVLVARSCVRLFNAVQH